MVRPVIVRRMQGDAQSVVHAQPARNRVQLIAHTFYQNAITIKLAIIAIPIFLLILHLRYASVIYFLKAIENVKTVNFHRYRKNFTSPALQICLSHRLQINQLNSTQLNNIFANKGYPIYEELQNASWWPKTQAILLHANWIVNSEVNGSQSTFERSQLYEHQTCFRTPNDKSKHFQVWMPGALQGLVLTMNLQQYEELSVIQSPEYTTLDITPFENHTVFPRNYNKIHITPGRFSSVRLRTAISDTRLRSTDDRPCIAAVHSIQSPDESRKQIDLCIKYKYASFLTEAKLKYEFNYSNLHITPAQLTVMSQALKSAVRLQSKYDPLHRYPIVKRLPALIDSTKMLLRYIDIEFRYVCDRLNNDQYPRNDFYHLPELRSELGYIKALDVKYGALVHRMVAKIFAHVKSISPAVAAVFASNFVESIRNWDEYHNERYAPKDKTMMKRIEAMRQKERVLDENALAGEIDVSFQQLTLQLDSFRSRSYATRLDVTYTEQFLHGVRSNYDCHFGATGEFMAPFTNRGTKRRFVQNNGKMVNVTGFPLVYPDTFRVVASHVPNARRVAIPMPSVVYCMSMGSRPMQRFGFNRLYDYIGRDAEYMINKENSLFMLNHFTKDYFDHSVDDSKGLMEFLFDDSDILPCGDLIGFYKIITTPTFSINQLDQHVGTNSMNIHILTNIIATTLRAMTLQKMCSRSGRSNYLHSSKNFIDHYKRNILESFSINHAILRSVWTTYADMEKTMRTKVIDVQHIRQSLQFKLKKLLHYLRKVELGESEEELSFFLKRMGKIMLGSVQIQVAEAYAKYKKFQNILTQQLDASLQLARVLQRKSSFHNYLLFDEAVLRMFGGQNFSNTAEKIQRCLVTTYAVTELNYKRSWLTMDSWLRQIRFFISRAKHYVESQTVGKSFLKNNIAVVHIFHEDFNIDFERNEYYMTLKQFMSLIGGIVGIYLGIGVPGIFQATTSLFHKLCIILMGLWSRKSLDHAKQ